jgi:sodium transport system ATP-binding protein
VIVVTDLRKFFGDVKAVNGISFEARDGEITGLLGPNGAGKTTTLRMLYSLLPPDGGRILIDAYYGELHGMSGRQIEARIATLVDTLDMADFIDRRTEGFSQGQRVKVAIARAMIHEPQTVLMDEPSNGLDVMSTRALRDYVRGLRRDGHSVVLSTHIMQEVAALCDRIVIIAKGEVAADGTANELLQRSGCDSLEDAFVKLIGSEEGLLA